MIDELNNDFEKNSATSLGTIIPVGAGGNIVDSFAAINPGSYGALLKSAPVNLSEVVGLASADRPVALSNESEIDFSILYQSDNPGIWALGLAILQNLVNEKILDSDQEAINFNESVAEAIRKKIIDQNKAVLDKLNDLVNKEDERYQAGTGPAGDIGFKKKKKSIWQIIGEFVLAVLIVVFTAGTTFWLLGILSAILKFLGTITKGGAAKFFNGAAEFCDWVNPVSLFLNAIFDAIEYDKVKKGASKKSLEDLEEARVITLAVVSIIIAVAVIVASLLAAPETGGVSTYIAEARLMQIVNSVLGIVQAINGVYGFMVGWRKREAADIQYEIDVARNIIESLQSFLQIIQDSIDAIIEHMKTVIENMNFGWSAAADMIKKMGEANVGVARLISI